MSMYRQLWLAIIISTLLALTGSLLASLLSARSYLEQQLTMKNEDNASALALSLSQQQPDAVTVELAVSALFDSGHYESIDVFDPMNKPMVHRAASEQTHAVPAWFIQRLPINAAPGQAQISSGWTQFGTVVLKSNSSFAYEALWKSALEMVLAVSIAGLIGGYLGSLILRRLKRPLQAVIDQAQAITERRFTTIDEPEVPELRQLAVAMNATVNRLKTMFAEEAARLEAVRLEANCDALTGLANRDFFMAQLRMALEGDDSSGGTLMLIRIPDLVGINRRLGRAATDDLLRRVGTGLSTQLDEHAEGVAARLNGADFALLLLGQVDAQTASSALSGTIATGTAGFFESGSSAYIAYTKFPRGLSLGALMSQLDSALAGAEADNSTTPREAVIADHGDAPLSTQEWTGLIQEAIAQQWVTLGAFAVTTASGTLLHRECPLRIKLNASGEWLPAGRFLPMAERLNLTHELDLAAVTQGLVVLSAEPSLPGLAINLSASSIEVPGFRERLVSMIRKHGHAGRRLWLELAEPGALRHFEEFRALCRELKSLHCRVGIEHFGRQFSQVGLLHDIGLDYLKVDASFVRGIENNPGNQAFLRGVSSIGHGIGVLVLAEGVTTDEELAALIELGFDGATGPGIKNPV
jgi:EAL domain-containing protein (putative c-di-GMP-specific phosphodiesterase class I)/GGDEF domain-containing protein